MVTSIVASEMPIEIPSYEEAHKNADTLVPRRLWAQAHADLSHLDALFDQLMRRFGAAIRIDGGPKHPYPRRDLVKRIDGETWSAGIVLEPTSSEADRRYTLGIGRSPRRRLFARRRPGTWTRVADVSVQELVEAPPDLIALVQRTVERAFGPVALSGRGDR
jgi:hypothetical protein